MPIVYFSNPILKTLNSLLIQAEMKLKHITGYGICKLIKISNVKYVIPKLSSEKWATYDSVWWLPFKLYNNEEHKIKVQNKLSF